MRKLMMALLVCACSLGMSAQDIAGVFTAMPDQYIPQLEHAWRQDLVDLFNQGKEARLKNTMNGYSSLKKLTKDYLLLQTTERSTVEMKLLPLINNTYVICMVTTVYGPAPDSRIDFFTTEWAPLERDELLTPLAPEWYLKHEPERKEDDNYRDAIARLDMELIHYTLSPDNLTLTATYSTPQYLEKEAQEKVAPYISAPKVYKWEKSHFE